MPNVVTISRSWHRLPETVDARTNWPVRAILGPETFLVGSALSEIWRFWENADQTIAVEFNLDGRAIEKRFHLPWVKQRAQGY